MDLLINNSFCKLDGAVPPKVEALVKQVLTYQNDIEGEKNNIFYRMRMLKQYGPKKKAGETEQARIARGRSTMAYYQKQLKELEANEWVCWYDNGTFPTGHLNIVKKALEVSGAQYVEKDQRKVPLNDHILKWYNKPFPMRYYQQDVHDLCVGEGRGVVESAVGTGKSLMQAYIAKTLAVTSLFVVPSSGLSQQLYNDFKNLFGKHNVSMVDTKMVRSGKELPPLRIITIQSMASLQKSGELSGLVHDVNAIFIDEIHHAGSASYTNLLPEIDHIYYRFGFTGTFLRNDSKSLDMWGFLSNVVYRYPAHKAISEGFLTPIEVNVYDLPGKRANQYKKEYDANYAGNPVLLHKLRDILEGQAFGQQVLILVSLKDKSGKVIHEFLNTLGINNSYISGDNTKEEINNTIAAFNEKQVQVLIGSSVIGEGIDVRSADHLIMCQGGKSEIAIVQATGRLVRLFEGKEVGYYHDFRFVRTKYMGKHLTQRLDIVKRNFAPRAINSFNL